jgi:predicted transglutaminase-like cysteine proteinase
MLPVTVGSEQCTTSSARGGDIVLDNLNAQIGNWSQARYRWVRMQTPANPDHWAAVVQFGA